MIKYSFLVFHTEYRQFLSSLRQLGVLHVIRRPAENTPEIRNKHELLLRADKTISALKQRNIPESGEWKTKDPETIIDQIEKTVKSLEQLEQEREFLDRELQKTLPWGDYDPEIIQKLHDENIQIRFYTAPAKRFTDFENTGTPVVKISEQGTQAFFVHIGLPDEPPLPDTQEIKLSGQSPAKLRISLEDTGKEITEKNRILDDFAGSSMRLLEDYKQKIFLSVDFEQVVQSTQPEAENRLMILEGWAPAPQKEKIGELAEKSGIVYISRRARPGDNIPVLLKNSSFGRLFEPIGSMFSLPDYHELDLTVFFAPFFMLFFGFCLGDAGYGLLFIAGAGLYKLRAKKEFRPYLSLIQFLGIATVIFGMVSGTFFGINLIEADIPWLESFKQLFLDPEKMFNLALILGGLQILFGLCLKAANQIRQFGFAYALSTLGWVLIFTGIILYFLLTKTGVLQPNKMILWSVIGAGGILILFFSDPQASIFSRIGKGIWDVYSTVTGVFGDLLSYIRLFALGLSSGILGFVINVIALQILGSSKILGPVFFVIFLILGHTLNILISSLGSFVHPMRLTFVEFYKNAGFKGGGEEYQPFSTDKTTTN